MVSWKRPFAPQVATAKMVWLIPTLILTSIFGAACSDLLYYSDLSYYGRRGANGATHEVSYNLTSSEIIIAPVMSTGGGRTYLDLNYRPIDCTHHNRCFASLGAIVRPVDSDTRIVISAVPDPHREKGAKAVRVPYVTYHADSLRVNTFQLWSMRHAPVIRPAPKSIVPTPVLPELGATHDSASRLHVPILIRLESLKISSKATYTVPNSISLSYIFDFVEESVPAVSTQSILDNGPKELNGLPVSLCRRAIVTFVHTEKPELVYGKFHVVVADPDYLRQIPLSNSTPLSVHGLCQNEAPDP